MIVRLKVEALVGSFQLIIENLKSFFFQINDEVLDIMEGIFLRTTEVP